MTVTLREVAGSRPQRGSRDYARNDEIAGQARNDGWARGMTDGRALRRHPAGVTVTLREVAGSRPQGGSRDYARNDEIAGQARNDGWARGMTDGRALRRHPAPTTT